ncbi:MAG: hypothetical protein M5U34_17385 [Chloroflexi bacterium]|nr:hypothetical protein [Chloroflexota bacterium]
MKENVSDLYDQITGGKQRFAKVNAKIPGLGGYMEKGQRRKADQILRETLAARLEQSRLQLTNVHQELGRDIVRAMDYAEPLGRADNLLMGLIGKIKDAPVGYAGFFDANKVKRRRPGTHLCLLTPVSTIMPMKLTPALPPPKKLCKVTAT